MDRELVLAMLLAGLATALCGVLVPRGVPAPGAAGAVRERVAFRRVLLPLAPAAVLIAALVGFALVESEAVEAVEVVPALASAMALIFGLVIGRAVVRAVASLRARPVTQTAATVGIWRPRVVLADGFVATLRPAEVAAVEMHERAHVRHRDPLRICVAQFLADLQWPAPAASERLAAWLHALELARDDEARRHGIDGADLASAIVKAARIAGARPQPAAGLLGDAARLCERVERLLTPVPRSSEPFHVPAVAFSVCLALAVPCGATYGELLILQVLGWSV